MSLENKLKTFAELITKDTRKYLTDTHNFSENLLATSSKVSMREGKKYWKVIRDTSCKYMIDKDTEVIYGTLGCKSPNKKKVYGTLDTIEEYFWGDYSPIEKELLRKIELQKTQRLIKINNAFFDTLEW